MAKDRVIIKIVILIVALIYFLLAQTLVVTGNTIEDNVIKNVGNNATNNSIKSVEPNKNKETITISVRNASLKDTVLGICRSYGISVVGVESLKGNITASVKGESPEEIIKELGRLYHFTVTKQHKTFLIESEDTALENRELYVVSPEHLPAESLSNIMGTVVKNDKMAVLSEQNEVIMHLTSGEKRRVETLINAVDKEPKQVQLEATIIAMEQSYAKEQGFRWSWLSLTGHGEDKTNSYGAVTFGKTPGGEAYKFFVKPELSLMERSGKAVLIAKPSIMALNGETAHILIGERIPVIEEAEVNGERKRSTRYEEVGIKLNYTPIITANGGVDAKIHAEVSTPIMVSEMKAYKISTRQAHTRVRLQPGEVLVIGGLMDNRDQHQIQKIPILGDIPLLGKLFRHSRKTKDSIEMLILVRANVV
ncbi:MAG: type II secretion system protein GspD [Veillonella sp.]|uniref:type II secretion system protein GspD n=1 Tax=Veillonella sp. TaxID=1926307 RepID=UPI001ED0904C|nr:secretion protein [Veillonella sp.]MBS6292773.1 type II secretion system protein GspD [Veillonella sp.]